MEGEGMVAIVQGLKDCGLAVTVINNQQLNHSLRSSSQNTGFNSPRLNEAPDRSPVDNRASQITDGHYTSTYQFFHCHAKPSSPPNYVTEFPPQRLERCPTQGNFHIGTGEYSMAAETSRARNIPTIEQSSTLGYGWINDRSSVTSAHLSPPRQYETASPITEVQHGRLSPIAPIYPTVRDSPTGRMSRSGRLPPSGRLPSRGWASSPIPSPVVSDQFANSLRRYPLVSPDRSSDMVQKILNYSQNKHSSKKSPQRTRSPYERPTRDLTTKNIQTYTRSKSEPTKDPGLTPNKIQSNKSQKGNKALNLPVIGSPCRLVSPCRAKSPMSYTLRKRSNSRKRSISPERSTSSKMRTSPNRARSPNTSTTHKIRNSTTYDYLKPGRGRKVEVRYLDDVRKCIRDTLKQIYDDNPPAICPNVSERYSQHRRMYHGDTEMDTEEDTRNTNRGQETEQQPERNGFFPCKSPVPQSSWRGPANCVCPKKHLPCVCTDTTKDIPKDFEEEKLGAKIAEETFNWVKDLPVYADETREDRVKREAMIMDLVNKLKLMTGDPDFETNARILITECIEQLPIWYPGGKNDQETFKNQITDELVEKLNKIVDKMTDIVSKWIKGLKYTDNIDKGEVVNNIVKRLKPLADRPEEMETEVKDMLQDLPILNKTKVIENMSGKLVDDLSSVAADVVMEKEIKKWLDNTPELSNGESNTKNANTLAKKIKLALSREKDDSKHQEVIRKVVDDWIDDITSGNNKLSTRIKANLADQLVNKLKPKEKFQPERWDRSRSLANQKDYVDFTWNWLANNDIIPKNTEKYEDAVNSLAKKLQDLQSSGAGDEETSKEIMNFLNYLTDEGETIVNKEKLAKQFVNDLTRNNERTRSLKQYEDRTLEWLSEVIDITDENREKYKGPVKELAKKLQKLQSRGAGEDEINEEIFKFFDFLTENGEKVVNKNKLAKKLIKDLKSTDEKPDLLKQYEYRILEWLSETANMPEEYIAKYKGRIKRLANKLQELQLNGAGDDKTAEEITKFLDYLKDEGVTIVDEDKLVKKLVKDLKNTNEASLLQQCEDRTFEWLTDVVGIPEEHIEKYKGPVKNFAKKLQKLLSRGAGEKEIEEETSNFLDFLTENGETVVNRDKLAKKLIKNLKNTIKKPYLLKQYEDRTSESKVVDIFEGNREKYREPVKDFAKTFQDRKEIMNFPGNFTEEGDAIVNKEILSKKLGKDLKKTNEEPSLLQQCEDLTFEWLTDVVDIPKEHIEKYKSSIKNFAKKLQKLISSGAGEEEIEEETTNFLDFLIENGETIVNKDKLANKLMEDILLLNTKPSLLKQYDDGTLEWLSDEGETIVKTDNLAQNVMKDIRNLDEQIKNIPTSKKRKLKGDDKFLKKYRQGVKSSGTSGYETTREKMAKNRLHDKFTTERILGSKGQKNRDQELLKEKVDTTKVKTKKPKDSLIDITSNKNMQGLDRISDDETTDRESAKNLFKDLITDLKQSVLAEISGLIENMASNLSEMIQKELTNNIADILTKNHNNLSNKNNKAHQDIKNLLIQYAKLSDEDASTIASAIINRVNGLSIEDSVILTRRGSSVLPTELSPVQRVHFVEKTEKEISDFVKDLIKDDSPESKKIIKEMCGKLAESLGEIISNPTVKDKKKAVLSHILDFFNDLPLNTDTPTAELTKSLADRILNIGFQTDYEELSSQAQYMNKLMDTLQDWVKELKPKKLDRTLKEKLARELAVDIFDRQKYLQLNPEAKTSNKEELARLKYEVYRILNQTLSDDDLSSVIRKVDDLMIRIEKLKKPDFVPTTEKVVTSQRSSFDEAYQSTSIPVQDSDEFIKENLKGAIHDWLKSLPLYQRRNSIDKRELEKIIPRLVSAIMFIIDNAPTAAEADKLVIEQIVKQLKNSAIETELKSHETFLRNTAVALLENLNALQLFQDISDRQETTTDPLHTILDDWMGSLPIKRLNASEAMEYEELKKEFASKLEQMRKKHPNDDEKIRNFIQQYLHKFPIEESTKKNQKFMNDQVEKLLRNLLIVPIKKSEYKSKVSKKAADILFDDIEDWCEKLPFKSTFPQAKQEIAKKEIASKLINKIGELNINPEVFNDEFLYIQMFEDELDNLLADMLSGDDKIDLPALKKNLLEKVIKARQKTLEEIAGQTYKHQLRTTISKNVPFQTLNAEESAAFEALKDTLVDAFINLHYVGGNEEQKQKYKTDIQKELIKFCDGYLKNHENVPLDTAKLNEDLYQALKAVPIPKDETLIPEVELAKVKEVVNKWVKELPLKMQAGNEKLKVDKLASVLAKKIRDIENQNELEHNTNFNDILKQAILQWMDKLPEHLNENIKNRFANKLVDTLGKTRESRRVTASMRTSIDAEFLDRSLDKNVSCKDTCKIPCSKLSYSTLSTEDAQTLEKIRARAKINQQKNTGSQTATSPCEKPGHQTEDAGTPAEVVPRLIVKEYYWDTASSQFVEPHGPCYREYPPCSPISSRRSPMSPSCSTNSRIYSPLPGSCIMPHRLCSPPCSNARLGSPKHTALSQRPPEVDPCRSNNRPASYRPPGFEQPPSPSPDLSQRRPSKRNDDHEPCSPCPFGMTQSSTPPMSYHRSELPSEEMPPYHCRGHFAKTTLGVDDKRPYRKHRSDQDSSRCRLDDCVRGRPFGRRMKPEGVSCRGNFRDRNEEMKRCSKCCGVHCPFPSYMYFK